MSLLVNRIAGFVVPFLVLYLTQDRGLTPATAGAVVTAVGLGSIAANLLGGWSSDRFGRRGTMIVGLFATSAALAWLAVARGLAVIWLAAVCVGLFGEIVRPAMQAAVADLVEPAGRVRAYGYLFWAMNLGFSVATVTAGQLARFGFGVLFAVNAAAAAVSGVIVWLGVPESRPGAHEPSVRFLPVLLRDTPTLVLAAAGTAYSVVYFQGFSTLPVVMAGHGLDTATYGWVIAVNGVVIVAVQPFLNRVLERLDPHAVYVAGLLVVGAGFAAVALAVTAAGYVAAVVVWTFGEMAAAAVVGTLYAQRAPVALRGRYLGVMGLTFAGGMALGPLIGTATLEHVGATAVWLGSGVLMLVAAGGYGWVARRDVRAEATDQLNRPGRRDPSSSSGSVG